MTLPPMVRKKCFMTEPPFWEPGASAPFLHQIPLSEDDFDIARIGGIELNDKNKSVTLDGEPVSLTPKEYEILKLLMTHPDTVYSPKEIYKEVWKENPFNTDNTVAVHIRHLREKLEIDPANPRYIKVIFGQGYLMEKRR